jgi:hypothetical protein
MKYLLGIALGLLLLLAPVARADSVYPGYPFVEIRTVDGVQIEYTATVVDVTPLGWDLFVFCIGPNPLIAAPYCSTDEPVSAFLPFDGSIYQTVNTAFGIPTPEPSTGGLLRVGACFLCAFVALGRRMA